MDFNKVSILNTYDLIRNYLQRENISSHVSKHLTSGTQKPVDGIFSSIINDSFIIFKFQESINRSNYFKYLVSKDELSESNYDRLEVSSSSKNITGIDYNYNSLYIILNIGNSFEIVTPNNIINYESLTLKEAQKLNNEIGKKYIIKISCGEKHCLFLTHAGMVYSMGDNSFCQLGIGQNNITKESKDGVMIKDLLNYRISEISAGKNHSFCFGVIREMTKEGVAAPNDKNIQFDPKRPYYLFGWGDNSFNQIGMKQTNRYKNISKPTKLTCNNNFHNPAIIGEELINICCGLNFSAILFGNGKLLTFGDNQYNQLVYKEEEVLPNFINKYLPKEIGKIVKIIVAGNSLLLISELNKILIFGKYNEPNINEVTIIHLVDNSESHKYIFNDHLLKFVIFNKENLNKQIIEKIETVKIDNFLVNTKYLTKDKEEVYMKNPDTKIKYNIDNNTDNISYVNNYSNNSNSNNSNVKNEYKNNYSNNTTNLGNKNPNLRGTNSYNSTIVSSNNNTSNQNVNYNYSHTIVNNNNNNNNSNNKDSSINKNINSSSSNNSTIEISSHNNNNLKTKTDLNKNPFSTSTIEQNKKYQNYKNIVKKPLPIQKHKYKNSYTIKGNAPNTSNSNSNFNSNNSFRKIDSNSIQSNNNSNITDISKEFNGAEKDSLNNKTIESNGNTSKINNNKKNDSQIVKEDNNILISSSIAPNHKNDELLKKISDNISNGNKKEENGNSNNNQNILITKDEIENKPFINKNILKTKSNLMPNKDRYDDYNNNIYANEPKVNETEKIISKQNINDLNKVDNKVELNNNNIIIKNKENANSNSNNNNNGGVLKNGKNEEKSAIPQISKESNINEKEINANKNENYNKFILNQSIPKENNNPKIIQNKTNIEKKIEQNNENSNIKTVIYNSPVMNEQSMKLKKNEVQNNKIGKDINIKDKKIEIPINNQNNNIPKEIDLNKNNKDNNLINNNLVNKTQNNYMNNNSNIINTNNVANINNVIKNDSINIKNDTFKNNNLNNEIKKDINNNFNPTNNKIDNSKNKDNILINNMNNALNINNKINKVENINDNNNKVNINNLENRNNNDIKKEINNNIKHEPNINNLNSQAHNSNINNNNKMTIKNNLNSNINKDLNKNINNKKNINKLPFVKNYKPVNEGVQISNKKGNISISKKNAEDENYDIFQSINNNKDNKMNNKQNVLKKNNIINNNKNININNRNNSPKIINIQVNVNNDPQQTLIGAQNKEINNNFTKPLSETQKQDSKKKANNDNHESRSIFRELSQFVSTTVNKINKYTQNRTDVKKDSFFEQLVSSNNLANFRNINPKILLNNIISGVPNRYRGRFWLRCIGNQLAITPDYFDINLSKYYEKNEDTKEIKYKLPFPYLGIFKEDTPLTSDLCDVINGFVISRPDIEYNEKISYLVGMLIINMDKYQAYVSFMNLLLNPNIIIYYLNPEKTEKIMEYGYTDTPGREDNNNNNKNNNKKIPSIMEKNLRRVIFKQLLFHNLPDLCSHLELLNVLPEDYFDEWNETIFCKNFNIDIAMKIWDLFVAQGEKIVFDAGIALIKEMQDDILDCEEKEEVLEILLNSQLREINEANVLKEMQKVEYPDWIQSEVENMADDTIIPISFNKN